LDHGYLEFKLPHPALERLVEDEEGVPVVDPCGFGQRGALQHSSAHDAPVGEVDVLDASLLPDCLYQPFETVLVVGQPCLDRVRDVLAQIFLQRLLLLHLCVDAFFVALDVRLDLVPQREDLLDVRVGAHKVEGVF